MVSRIKKKGNCLFYGEKKMKKKKGIKGRKRRRTGTETESGREWLE